MNSTFTRFTAKALFALLLFCGTANAQSWQWLTSAGSGVGGEIGRAACTDAAGNAYFAGNFNGSTLFGSIPLTSAGGSDIFVAKFNAAGTCLWAVRAGGAGGGLDAANGICTDGSSVYITGTFAPTTATFGAFTLTTNTATSDGFIAKLDASTGGFTWAVNFSNSTSGGDVGHSMCIDGSGNPYVSGNFAGTVNFGSASYTSSGVNDMFIAKVNPANGAFVWGAVGGGTGADNGVGSSICYVPGLNEVVAAGSFGSSSTYYTTTPASGPFNFTNSGSNDIVLLEVNAATGVFLSATQHSGSGFEDCMGMCYDPSTQNVMMVGYFASATISFGGNTLNSAGGEDIFIASYNPTTNTFPWAQRAGGALNERAWAVSSPGNGVIAVTGQFRSSPTAFGSTNLNAVTAGADVFVTALVPSSGAYIWAVQASGNDATLDDIGRGIAYTTNGSGNVYLCGQFAGTLTAGASSVTSAGSVDIWFAKLLAPPPLVATQSQVNLTCNGVCTGSATVVASGGVAPYTYSWSPSGGSGATASSLCAINYTCTITDAVGTSITKTFTITQPPAIVITPISQTNVSCFNGSNGAASVTASGGTGTLTYNWTPLNPTGDGTGSVTGLTAQVYTVTVTDANGCNATRTFNITQPSALSTTGGQTNVGCFGASTGSATVNVTGGTPGYTYAWAPSGGNAATTTNRPAGLYTVTVTDANGCQTTRTFNITQPASAISGSTVVTNVACFGGNTGAINLTPAGGTPGYTYNWLPSGPTTEDRTGLVAGTYSVQITDLNGCQATVTSTVTQPASPVSGTTVVTNVSCFGGSNGAINLTPTGGTAPYTFNWLPSGPTTEDRTGLVAGTFSVQITDANGCTGTVTATVTQPTSPVSGTTVVTNVACFGGNTGAINLTPTGGTAPYTFNWLPSGPTTEDRTGLTAGTFSVQITDANGCTGTVTATVTQPTSPVSGTTVVTNVACFGGNTGAINLTPSGGTAPYTFNWLPSGPTTEDRTGLTAGTFSVQITDANGCTGTVTATVTQPASPVSGTTVVTNVACFGGNTGAINLTPSGAPGPWTFQWLPSGPTTEDRTGLTAGTYSVQITNANGCTGTVTATVTQPTSPVSGTTVVTNVSCFGGSNGAINLTPTGGTAPYTFNWLPSGPTTEDRTGLVAGTFSVQITDANGCTGTVTATVTQPTSPVSGTTVVTNVACFGGNTGAINLTPTGGTGPYTFNWLPSGPTTEDRTGLTAGTFSVQITDANGCTGTVTATVTQPPTGVSGTTVVTNVACFGGNTGAINLTPTGGTGPYTFNWLPSGPTTEDRTGLVAGTYSVQITDVNGCAGTVTATVTQPAAPVSGTTVVTNVACFGGNTGAINLTPTGGTGPYTFNWLPSGPTTEDRTGLTAGTFSVQITDANGCTGTVTATVTQPTSPVSGTTVVTNVACFGGTTGAINLTPTGGTAPYTFNWLPSGPTTEDRTGLAAGTFSVQITDANGCTGTVTATVTQPTSPVSGTTVVTNVSCFGGSNGAINLTPTGGTAPYTFNWLPSGPTTEDRTGLTAGTFSVQITDANGCTGTVTATVTQPPTGVSGTTVVTNVACFGGNTGAINLTPTGGTGPYTFNWLPSGPTTEDRTGLTAGTFSVQITDANGCTGTVTATVTQPAAPVSGTTVVTNVSCFGGSNGAINLTPTGGTAPYTFNWLPSGPTTEDRTGLTAGTFSVQITDANGCTGTVTASVTQPAAPVSGTTVVTNVSCFGGNTGAINLTPTGGTGPYSYMWLPSGPTTEDRTGLTAGTFSVQITDANGCTGTVTATVTQATVINAVMTQTNVSCAGGNNGSASVAVSGGTPGYTYSWAPTGGTAATATGLSATCYTVTITDASGCTRTQSVCITQPIALSVSSTVNNVTCNAANNGSATVSVMGGIPSYTYSWAPSGGTAATATGLSATSYTCTITDANGCTITHSVALTEPTVITSTDSYTDITCFGANNGTASVSIAGGTPGYTYMWSPSGGTGATATGLGPGMFTCTVTDANGCIHSSTFLINEPSAITANPMQNNISCAGGGNGHMMVSPTGGTGTFTYSWAPVASSTNFLNGSPAGTYTCTITDANGCTTTQTFNLTEPTALVATTMQTNVTCNGGSNGDAMVMVTGGVPSYTYAWAPSGGTAATATGLTAGMYTCTITDANGCTLTQTFDITEPAAISAATTQTNVSCPGGNDGMATVTPAGGTAPYGYSWSTGGTTDTEANLFALNTYTCIITDANGCTFTQTVSLTEPAAFTFSSATTNVSCNGGTDGAIDLTMGGGTAPYLYDWNSGAFTTEDISGLSAGNYICDVTDANGCTFQVAITVSEPTAIADNAVTTDPTGCTANDGMIDLSTTGGTGPYTYLWSNTATTEDISGLDGGVYSVVITDATGCTHSATFTLTEPGAPVVSWVEPFDSACGAGDITPPYTLSGESPAGGTWSGPGVSGSTFDATMANLGTQNIIVYTYTDVNGCSGSATDSIFVDICMGVQTIASNTIDVYPNPSNGVFNVNTEVNSVITVYDALGNVVMNVRPVNQKTELDLSGFANGIYMMTVQSGDQISTERLVLNK